MEDTLKEADLLTFLKVQVGENLMFPHEFRITISECPNACSQPQIKDFGHIGARVPIVADEPCTACGECASICPDAAVRAQENAPRSVIDAEKCVECGKCIHICPTGIISEEKQGWKILLAGKLGRHPRLAQALPCIFSDNEVIEVLKACLDFYKERSQNGKRFGEVFNSNALFSLEKSIKILNVNSLFSD